MLDLPGTEELVSCTLVTPRIRATTPTTMGDAKSRRALSAFGTTRVFTKAIPAMFHAVWFPCYCLLVTSLNTTKLRRRGYNVSELSNARHVLLHHTMTLELVTFALTG
jgi:hypothetical protein